MENDSSSDPQKHHAGHASSKESFKAKSMHFYEKNYKVFLIIPFILLILGIAQLSYMYVTTGDVVHRGISLKGGVTVSIVKEPVITAVELESALKAQYPGKEMIVRELADLGKHIGYIVESDIQSLDDRNALITFLSTKLGGLSERDYSVEITGASLGDEFFRQMEGALLFAFIFMGVVVFVAFRNWIPSLAIIISAFTDLILTIVIFNLLGGKLSTAGIAALLLVIGYSVDTNVLLANHMLKRTSSTITERVFNAFGTGWLMILTTLAAVITALFMTNSDAIREIMLIMLIGLAIDTMTTWFQNAGMLRWFLLTKGAKR